MSLTKIWSMNCEKKREKEKEINLESVKTKKRKQKKKKKGHMVGGIDEKEVKREREADVV